MKESTQAVIDIETGGFSKTTNGIAEIALIITDKNNVEIDHFSAIIKRYKQENGDSMFYSSKAEDVHGISRLMQETEGIEPEKACRIIDQMIDKYNVDTFVGHNVKFDADRLQVFFDRFLEDNQINFDVNICTLKLAKQRLTVESYSLGSLCEHFNILNDNAHRALSDVRATNEVLKNLMK